MDFRDDSELSAFRHRLRDWVSEYARRHDIDIDAADFVRMREWYRDLAAAGYVGVSLPEHHGGKGLSDAYEAVINQELAVAGAPPPPPIGHIAHAMSDFGSDELVARFVPRLLDCSEAWCQGFSEPGAGSDLAGISTVGVVDGGSVRVSGQKIWTSGAMWSQWCLLLLRTELEAERHGRLTMLVVDMNSPGITRRQIALSTGSDEFAEVFFDNVEVPQSNIVGERGQGWDIAMHMLTYERGPADMGWTGRLARDLAIARQELDDKGLPADDGLRTRLARTAGHLRVLEWHVLRTLSNRASSTSSAGSLDKLLTTRVEQDLYHVLADLQGSSAVLGESEAFRAYLHSRAQSIYGGTQQIQRNIVAQRLVGLPRH